MISKPESRVAVRVISTDEEMTIARHTLEIVQLVAVEAVGMTRLD